VRDVRGRPVAPDKDEKVKGRATDSEESAGKQSDPHKHLDTCEDCMKNVASHMGIAKSADGMKAQDQGGKTSGAGEGHDTEKRGASYGRRRH